MTYSEALAIAVICSGAAAWLLSAGWLVVEFIQFLYELYPPAGTTAVIIVAIAVLALIIWAFDHIHTAEEPEGN